MKYLKETSVTIRNDEDDTYIKIGPEIVKIGDEFDDWGCIQVRFFNAKKELTQSLLLPPDLATVLGEALIEIAKKSAI